MRTLFFSMILVLTGINSVYSCSAIVLKNGNQILLAKNFDWTYRDGIIIKNLRGTDKTAYFTHSGEPAQWTSKYGSVTFNQNGKEMPYGGMNEKGLAVEMLWLEQTKYNINETKSYLNELEWIQYQLDNFETVQQVIEHLDNFKVYPIKGKIHYILTDLTGESVIIEYLNTRPLVYKKEANVCQTITNNSVLQSEPYKNQFKGIRKNNTASTYRYYQLEQKIADIGKHNTLNEAYAFKILNMVTIPKGDFKTMWSIVYNVTEKTISFFTDTHKEIKRISLSELDFNKELAYCTLNQNDKKQLNTSLRPLTETVNQFYVSSSLIHLGFDESVTKDISLHQFMQNKKASSYFSDNYFHFDISIPLLVEGKRLLFVLMDSEENFKNKKAVTGGYLFGTTAIGTPYQHIYGLKNGAYAMVALIDENKNSELDFDINGNPIENYATFSDFKPKSMTEITFNNASNYFTKDNSKLTIEWR